MNTKYVLTAVIIVLLAGGLTSAQEMPLGIVSAFGIGEQRVAVILASFPDIKPTMTMPAAEKKIFTDLDRYIRNESYGKTWLAGVVRGVYKLDKPVASYRISAQNLSVDKVVVTGIVQEIIDKADGEINFRDFPTVLIILCAPREAYGMMGFCAYPGMLGWRDITQFKSASGEEIGRGVAVYCENAHLGVFAHDLVHIMGGLYNNRRVVPCLYDHELQGQEGDFRGFAQFYMVNMGNWDPMSCHYYKGTFKNSYFFRLRKK